MQRLVGAVLALSLTIQPCFAWSEGGHHLIASLAFDLLAPEHRQEIQQLLRQHPRFAEDFQAPANITDEQDLERWIMGRAGYWPDVARSQPQYNRPNWHYQLGASLTIGDNLSVPAAPGPLPAGANLNTKDLHIAQAVELCSQVLRDTCRSGADRALAICWLAHLVADAHQPCHAGSLYVEGVFPEGDRGANSIPSKQGKNLHALWDGLLGPRFSVGGNRRRALEIQGDTATWRQAAAAAAAPTGTHSAQWLAESAAFGRSHVYAPEVLDAVEAARRSRTTVVETVNLSETYLKAAGSLAQQRAAFAAHRLAHVLALDLGNVR